MILLVLFWILIAVSLACLIYGQEYGLALLVLVIALITMGLLPYLLSRFGVS